MTEEICFEEQASSVNVRGWNKIIFFHLIGIKINSFYMSKNVDVEF